MARPAKTVDIYNNYGEVITTTIPEFVQQTGASRRALYKKSGWTDEDGTVWRIDALPVFAKDKVFAEQQKMYNIFEQEYLFWVYTGKNRTGISVEDMKKAIISYNHNYEMLDTHHFSNLFDVFTGKTDEAPTVNLNYHHYDITYGRKGSTKSWTTENTIDKWLDEVEAENAVGSSVASSAA